MSYLPPGEFAHLDEIRYDFSSGEALKAEVDTLFQSGKAPDFVLHSTKGAYVDAADYSLHRYSHEQSIVDEVVKRRSRAPILIGGVSLRRIQYGAPSEETGEKPEMIRLSLLPANPADFFELTSALNRFPDIYPRPEPPRHYMYANFSPTLFAGLHDGDEEEYKERVNAFDERIREGLAKGLFSASLLGLSHVPRERPVGTLLPGWRTGREE